MAISVSCTCGKTLSVKDELAGKRGKCPACGTMLTIPQPVATKPARPQASGSRAGNAGSPASASKPQVKSASAAPVKAAPVKNVAAPALAALDLPPLDGDESLPAMGWDDIASEGHLSMAGAPLSANTGHISTATSSGLRGERPPGGYPGELICPICSADLDTITADDVKPQMWLGALTGVWLSVAPFKCRNCGPIKYNQLVGESKKTAKKRGDEKDRDFIKGILFIGLVIGAIVAVPLFVMPWWRDFRFSSLWSSGSSTQQQQETNERFQKFQEETEKGRKEREEIWKGRNEEKNKNPGGFRPPSSPPPGSGPTNPNTRSRMDPNAKPIHQQGEFSTPAPKPAQPMPPPANPFQTVE